VSGRPSFSRRRNASLAAGIAGLALCGIGAISGRAQFFHSYLLAYVFWLGIGLGSLAVLMLYHLVGGKWGFLIRRVLEASTATLPLLLVLFVPIAFGLKDLYPWTHADVVRADPQLVAKSGYLNVPFFLGRVAVYFAIWIGMARLLNRWSIRQDETGETSLALRMQSLSAPGLVVYAATTLFASVDWIMSLTPLWWSTIYGMIFMVGQGLSTIAFAIVLVRGLSSEPEIAEALEPGVHRDHGNLLFMFIILTAYMAFSQLIIVWSGNLTDEITWYMPRLRTSWGYVSSTLLLLYFAAPFALLLSRRVKYNLKFLSTIAGGILLLRVLELVWLIEPAFHPAALFLSWMDLAAPVGLGGVWLWYFFGRLESRPLLPLHDPRMEGAAEHA
jgi:hypothetical protein